MAYIVMAGVRPRLRLDGRLAVVRPALQRGQLSLLCRARRRMGRVHAVGPRGTREQRTPTSEAKNLIILLSTVPVLMPRGVCLVFLPNRLR